MILITGASGQLASLVAEKAKEAGLQFQTASRSLSADRLMDFDRPETLDFSGISTLFLLSAGYAEDDVIMKRHGAVLAAASQHGVSHVVYTSLSAAGDHLGFALAHRWTEQALIESGLGWTILRNGLYAELIGMLAAPRDGRITIPLGRTPIAAVARTDLAEAALKVLSAPEDHAGITYELSGTRPFSAPQLAQRLAVTYEPSSFSAERERLSALPLLPFQAPMLMSIASAATGGFFRSGATDLQKLVPQPLDALSVAYDAARRASN
ncbi:Quinone oxidoreductase 2 [Agrobacterium sp. DSM 25558]|uniref:NAD(P)H-binding protein n=1 Tax=Agrobacterium sp. DSM 25558 TaxID=1907665 RepID=UPI0009725B0C|nr:NAD(P)H-binding protein [Agrobacterium sp. DSM 25558]SCX31378.1 Quinone oxidoreductase 2 [Agrobacterium sp. DSM 25558]